LDHADNGGRDCLRTAGPVLYASRSADEGCEGIPWDPEILQHARDADKVTCVARLAAQNDSRITPVGKFIRAVRIDEPPQLVQHFKRARCPLSVPAPERPQIIREYIEEMPEFAYRTRVKAGLAWLCAGIRKVQYNALRQVEAGSFLH
ncbi:MAG: sugar transferase, partial [Eisenbergiella sp.]